MDLEIITTFPIRVACVHNLPYLVISAEGTTLAESRPAHTSKCGCTDRLGSGAPGQRLLCSSSFSMIFCNMNYTMQQYNMNITLPPNVQPLAWHGMNKHRHYN